MSIELITILFLIGFMGSLLSGMLGIGGSIVKYPMLLYIPAFFGAAYYTAQEVSALAMVQVLFATLAGVLAYKKSNLINGRLVLDMGVSIVIGSLLGGYGFQYLPDDLINVIYGLLAAVAAVMMFLPGPAGRTGEITDGVDTTDLSYNRLIAIISSFIVGLLSGIVVGGAFILIPIMISILHIPTRVTIASSLAIVFLSSIGGTLGKVMTGHVLGTFGHSGHRKFVGGTGGCFHRGKRPISVFCNMLCRLYFGHGGPGLVGDPGVTTEAIEVL